MITRWVSEPANRLAVDPKAMAVSCSLRTGQSALLAGRNDLASDVTQAVLTYPDGAYPYHATQARGLARLNGEAESLRDAYTGSLLYYNLGLHRLWKITSYFRLLFLPSSRLTNIPQRFPIDILIQLR